MGLRPATQEEIDSYRPVGIQQVQGVSKWERFVAKNFTSSPDAMKRYLESAGYETRQYGKGGFNFAVRRGAGEPWKVVDPDGLDGIQDVTDFIGDIGSGALSTVGASLGPLGFVAGGAGAELARQGIGSALGVPDNVDVGQVAMSGAFAGGAGLIGKYGGRVARAAINDYLTPALTSIGHGASELGAKVAGISAAGARLVDVPAEAAVQSTSPGAVARTVAAMGEKSLKTIDEAAQWFAHRIERLKVKPFPARQDAQQMLKDSGRFTDFTDIMDELDKYVPIKMVQKGKKVVPQVVAPAAGTKYGEAVAKDRSLQKALIDMREAVVDYLGPNVRLDKVPLDLAEGVKRIITHEAAGQKAYLGVPVPRDFTRLMAQTGHSIRMKIGLEMAQEPADVFKQYLSLRRSVEQTTAGIKRITKAINNSPTAASSFVSNLYGATRGAYVRAIHDLERNLGVELEKPLFEAVAAHKVGELSYVPRIGGLRGPAIAGGLFGAAGASAGGPLGFGAGALLGGVLGSNKAVIGMIRAGQSVGAGVSKVGAGNLNNMISALAQSAAAARAKSGAAAPGVARQDGKPKRRVVLGQ